MRTDRTLIGLWHVATYATPADITAMVGEVRAARARIAAHPATLEWLCRTASPFGPLARSTTLTAVALGVDVEADRSIPEGIVTAVR
jgi:hypothetical protein